LLLGCKIARSVASAWDYYQLDAHESFPLRLHVLIEVVATVTFDVASQKERSKAGTTFPTYFRTYVMLDETLLLFSWERAFFGMKNGMRYQKIPSNSHL